MTNGAPVEKAPQFQISASRQLAGWMAEHQVSLGFTTYQAGLIFLVGLQPNGQFRFFNRFFPRCMGLWTDGQTLWLSSLFQLWRFENSLAVGESYNGYDRVFVPRIAYTTGDLDIHDIGVDWHGRVVFVNTLYSCLATVSDRHSFAPLWQPPFITKLAAEDRCHLNGLAIGDGRARYATAICRSDATDAWRSRRDKGGCVLDIESNDVIAEGLSMPHSPRLHRDGLWLLESGTGHFGTLDVASGSFEALTFCPGYLRGLAFHHDFAVVGLSQCRHERSFTGLKLQNNLAARDVDARCGLMVIDLRSGDIVHWLRIDGEIEELYDVVVLPDVIQPMALGVRTDEIRRTLSIDEPQAL
jgi:uncharacterized protein (TIGR03032 family)